MKNSRYIWKNQKQMRTGYTTGSCAAGAAKAAATMLLRGGCIEQVKVDTPKGISLYLDVEYINKEKQAVSCAIKKDSGDDPDVTDGIYVYAKVERSDRAGIEIRGGDGVGVVTRRGLDQDVGQPAINRVPRQMIRSTLEAVQQEYGYEGGLNVTISIPEGVRLARKTFNPRLGIEGGISVLGTTGIVEPMSEKALIDTIHVEMRMLRENGHEFCYVVPGNYGSDFLRDTLGYDGELAVKCSNYIGEMLDSAVALDMKGILLIGHVGKLIKVAAGIMNTHSRQADGRMEVLAAHAALAGADTVLVQEIMACITTTEGIEVLERAGILQPVMETVMAKIGWYLENRVQGALMVGAIMFQPEYGILGHTTQAADLLGKIKKKRGRE